MSYTWRSCTCNNPQVFDLASGGATIDAALVAPFEPTVLYVSVFHVSDFWLSHNRWVSCLPSSIVDQVAQFNKILAPKPVGAEWNASNSLFAFWIGINDVVRNILQSACGSLLAHLSDLE